MVYISVEATSVQSEHHFSKKQNKKQTTSRKDYIKTYNPKERPIRDVVVTVANEHSSGLLLPYSFVNDSIYLYIVIFSFLAVRSFIERYVP